MQLRRLHRISALLVGSFIFLHLLNHAALLLGGAQAHIDMMEKLRLLYRYPVVEVALLASTLFQALSGLAMVWRGRKGRAGLVPWVQALSGSYLALFLLIHVGAVLNGRAGGVDTNLYFAAAGIHAGAAAFFLPYYFLAVWSLFLHIGCALYWNLEGWREAARIRLFYALAAVGAAFAVTLLLAMAGVTTAIHVPAEYLASFR